VVRISGKLVDTKEKVTTVKVTMHLPETLVAHMDEARVKLSNEYLTWERSTFVGYLISIHKSGKLEQILKHTENVPASDTDQNNDEYSSLLKMSGYQR
jgi:hypothetical protein